jgi:predicted enzyme related to lactoylglutathione lyase
MWWTTTVEAPDPGQLARFYSDLLGWPISNESEAGVSVAAPEGSAYLTFTEAAGYRTPVWPPVEGEQRPMMHFDIEVDDLDSAVEEAVALGATVSSFQPNEPVRVMFDPAGHPFCLCREE